MRANGAGRCPMPKLLAARPPLDAAEEAQVRRLARSLHAPADWVLHARMIACSWDGLRTRGVVRARRRTRRASAVPRERQGRRGRRVGQAGAVWALSRLAESPDC